MFGVFLNVPDHSSLRKSTRYLYLSFRVDSRRLRIPTWMGRILLLHPFSAIGLIRNVNISFAFLRFCSHCQMLQEFFFLLIFFFELHHALIWVIGEVFLSKFWHLASKRWNYFPFSILSKYLLVSLNTGVWEQQNVIASKTCLMFWRCPEACN